MKTYRDLIVWQKAMKLVTLSYKVLNDFPREETYGLTSQLKRAAIAIPSNIAEGYGRDGTKDYIRFLNIPLSSLFEYQTQIEIAKNLDFISNDQFQGLYEDSRGAEQVLCSLIRKIKEKTNL